MNTISRMSENGMNKWTDANEQELLCLFNSGKTPKEISPLICRSIPAVQARLLRLGKLTPEKAGFAPVRSIYLA